MVAEVVVEPKRDLTFQQTTERGEEGRKGNKAPLPGKAGSPSEDELEHEELLLDEEQLLELVLEVLEHP